MDESPIKERLNFSPEEPTSDTPLIIFCKEHKIPYAHIETNLAKEGFVYECPQCWFMEMQREASSVY